MWKSLLLALPGAAAALAQVELRQFVYTVAYQENPSAVRFVPVQP